MQSSSARKDTGARKAPVQTLFGLTAVACGAGLAWLPGRGLDCAFVVMDCPSGVFAPTGHGPGREGGSHATPTDKSLWGWLVWGGFALAMALTGWGLMRAQVESAYRAFLGVCWLYVTSSALVLARRLHGASRTQRADAANGHGALQRAQ